MAIGGGHGEGKEAMSRVGGGGGDWGGGEEAVIGKEGVIGGKGGARGGDNWGGRWRYLEKERVITGRGGSDCEGWGDCGGAARLGAGGKGWQAESRREVYFCMLMVTI